MTAEFAPLLPLPVIAALALLMAVTALVRLPMAPIGAVLRIFAGLAALLFLLGPERVIQTFDRLPDQALLLLDESGSMGLADRAETRDRAAERLRDRLEAEGIRVIEARFGDQESTAFGEGLAQALASTDRAQLGAVFVLSDGRVTGVEEAQALALPAPVHAVLIGDPEEENDRRISWISTPRFGLVGETMRLEFMVEDTSGTPSLPVTLRIDGEEIMSRQVLTGEAVSLDVPLERPGERIIELAVPAVAEELTTRNNAISTAVNVIRDRLRVLLISGEPHAGERVWRNVLKSDPAVDLVHFTILKPADKVAPAGPEELNLIPFPSRELFLDKLQHFNVVIFDRYTYRGVISSFELAEVARYVEKGGAVLVAAGPELTITGSLVDQPNLSYILPASPTGGVAEQAFIPTPTELGRRHPITASLRDPEEWGRWLRLVPAEARRGTVLMEAQDGAPLLVTDRVGEGRVAMLLSDHLWLWARGFDGGGPHREFLRRLVHWLMAEPELEEEALRARLSDEGTLTIERQSLSAEVGLVTVEADSGEPLDPVALENVGPGRWAATIEGIGAERVRLSTTTEDGRLLTTAAIRRRGASGEFSAVTVSAEALAPLLASTGGGAIPVTGPGEAVPDIRRLREGRDSFAGASWLGVARREARAILSEERGPLLPRWGFAVAASGLLLLAWLTESGRVRDALRGLPGAAGRASSPA